jgi:hypothetical protein
MKKTHCPSAYLSRAVLEIDQNSAQQLPWRTKANQNKHNLIIEKKNDNIYRTINIWDLIFLFLYFVNSKKNVLPSMLPISECEDMFLNEVHYFKTLNHFSI